MNVTIEPDNPNDPKRKAFRKKIVQHARIQGTRSGHNCILECGHRIQIYGDIRLTGGVALCQQCRSGRIE